MTIETFDQGDEKTWPDPKKPTHLHTYLPTYVCTSIREHPKGAILETCDLWDIWSEWSEDMTWHKKTKKCKDNFGDLWHLRHWLQFWQLRTWICENNCYLTIKSDSGQHLQFLQCLINTSCQWWSSFGPAHGWCNHFKQRCFYPIPSVMLCSQTILSKHLFRNVLENSFPYSIIAWLKCNQSRLSSSTAANLVPAK